MKIADLVKRKKQRVTVRVPTKHQSKLGHTATGTVQGLEKGGNNVTWVKVKIARKGVYKFRPQDLDAA